MAEFVSYNFSENENHRISHQFIEQLLWAKYLPSMSITACFPKHVCRRQRRCYRYCRLSSPHLESTCYPHVCHVVQAGLQLTFPRLSRTAARHVPLCQLEFHFLQREVNQFCELWRISIWPWRYFIFLRIFAFKTFARFLSLCSSKQLFFSCQNIVSFWNSIRLMAEKPDNVKWFLIIYFIFGGV